MNEDIRWKQRFENYKKALKSLKKSGVESNPTTDLEQEGLVQRFEFTWELAWQTLQDVLVKRGIYTVKGSNPVVQEAGNLQIISNLKEWDKMRRDRNRASHTYDSVMLSELVKNIKSVYLSLFLELEKTLDSEPE